MYPNYHGERLLAEPYIVRQSFRDALQAPEAASAKLNPAALCATGQD
ncbi:MAG: hypothetical protein ABIV07_13740 [Polaromonas sp.]